MSDKLEIMACQKNPERYSLLVEEIFYRYKNEQIFFNSIDTKSICALFYIINFFDKLPHLSLENFQIDTLRNVVPEGKWK